MLKSRAIQLLKLTFLSSESSWTAWCKSKHFNLQLPFPLSVVSLYLFEVQQSGASSSSVILAHAALKGLHSFVPSLDRNPLHTKFCRNIIESSYRRFTLFSFRRVFLL